MRARSRGEARPLSDCAFWVGSWACGSSSDSIIALMFGPSTRAWPQ